MQKKNKFEKLARIFSRQHKQTTFSDAGFRGILTFKVLVTTAAFFFYFSEKTSLDISCELSAWQTIHMKYQDLFSLKNKKKIECPLLQILLGALRIKG